MQALPPDARQPYILRNRFAAVPVVSDHAAAHAQGLGSAIESEVVAVHPSKEHFVGGFAHLFARPGIDIVGAEFAVFPFDTGAVAGNVRFGEQGGLAQAGQESACKLVGKVNLKCFARAPADA